MFNKCRGIVGFGFNENIERERPNINRKTGID
jgi:hypothetical protein